MQIKKLKEQHDKYESELKIVTAQMNELQKEVLDDQTTLIKLFLIKQQSKEPTKVKPQVIEDKPVHKVEETKQQPVTPQPKYQPEPVKVQAEKVQQNIVNRSNLELPCFYIGQMQEKKIEEVIKRFRVNTDCKAPLSQKPNVPKQVMQEPPKV